MGRANTKHNRVANINKVLNHLRKTTPKGGCTLNELAQLCKVSTRNIYRYLNDLEDIGFDIVRPAQSKPGVTGQGKYRLRSRTMPQSRVDANLMMLIGLYAKKQNQYREQLRLLYEFLIRYIAMKNSILLPPNWKLTEIKQPITAKSNALTYLPAKESKKTTVKSAVYENVVIMLSSAAAKKYHQEDAPFKAVEEQMSNGSLLLNIKSVKTNEILPWLFQWGDEAEVIAPISLRNKLTDYCLSILNVYSRKYVSDKIS